MIFKCKHNIILLCFRSNTRNIIRQLYTDFGEFSYRCFIQTDRAGRTVDISSWVLIGINHRVKYRSGVPVSELKPKDASRECCLLKKKKKVKRNKGVHTSHQSGSPLGIWEGNLIYICV